MTDDAAPASRGLTIERIHTTEGTHPYDTVTWGTRDVIMRNWRDGSINFEQRDVEFPVTWSDNAVNIVTSKYFRGALGTEQRESSLRQLIDRVVGTYRSAGEQHGYLTTEESAEIFEHELTYALLHQIFSFNSPVWFNVGTASPQQVSACFILSVDDSMESILNWYKEEGLIFKGGSGSGVNLSRLRSSRELLSSGGTASGPVSFMRGADASAGTIKSGGATRRAAKMVVLDVDHPDVEEFIWTKAREEDKIRALRDAGFDMDLGGSDIVSVQYQNANNSVRLTDEFMRAARSDEPFNLTSRTTGETISTVSARRLMRDIATAAWRCGDPGVQFTDTINRWHTCPETGPITSSNPCSEYVHLDNSSCNLASINLLRFLTEDNDFDFARFASVVKLVITAMDISICFANFPTPKIGEVSRAYRQLGIGYANLGALLMSLGLGYDSAHGRDLAARITALLTGAAYQRSAEIAEELGAYDGYAKNAEAHLAVINDHTRAAGVLNDEFISYTWARARRLGQRSGLRNAQVSLLAPTGTIGLMMDCDTTGIEPALGLVTHKKLSTGGSMTFVNQSVDRALETLRLPAEQISDIKRYIVENGTVIGAPHLGENHYDVFSCAMGDNAIMPMGHVRMMAAVQPFLSGAISKTVNLPESATVEDIEEIYLKSWELGLKALAVYRDNCKVGQPLSVVNKDRDVEPNASVGGDVEVQRRHLPRRRSGITTSFSVGGAEGYLTSSAHDDGTLGEIFLKMSKQGSTLAGMMDAFSIAISIGLQYGVPLETYIGKFMNLRFEPAGMTSDPELRMATSLVDYVFRRLALDYIPLERREELNILTNRERAERLVETKVDDEPTTLLGVATPIADVTNEDTSSSSLGGDAPICMTCGVQMRRSGSCHVCESCGETSGCS